jgi:hypothetical protein
MPAGRPPKPGNCPRRHPVGPAGAAVARRAPFPLTIGTFAQGLSFMLHELDTLQLRRRQSYHRTPPPILPA